MVSDGRFCALRVADRQVLLLFKRGASTSPMASSGGIIPPHDGRGELHLAFAIPAAELAKWEEWLEQQEVAVESRVLWPRGGQSVYFRDPDRHLVALVTPGCWPNY